MGGGKSSTPKVEPVELPTAPTPAPPPEPTAAAPTVGGGDEGLSGRKSRESKKRGTSPLRIDLNVAGSSAPGAASAGLSIPKG